MSPVPENLIMKFKTMKKYQQDVKLNKKIYEFK